MSKKEMFELLQINYQHLGTLSSIIGGGALGGIVLFFINRSIKIVNSQFFRSYTFITIFNICHNPLFFAIAFNKISCPFRNSIVPTKPIIILSIGIKLSCFTSIIFLLSSLMAKL